MSDEKKEAFLRDYEAICRKHGMVIRAYGWEVDCLGVVPAEPDVITGEMNELRE